MLLNLTPEHQRALVMFRASAHWVEFEKILSLELDLTIERLVTAPEGDVRLIQGRAQSLKELKDAVLKSQLPRPKCL